MLKSNKNSKFTLGILGGGQLAKMTMLEAYKMGLDVAIIENGELSPAGNLTKYEFASKIEINPELDKFIEKSDIITLENEFIDPIIIEYIEKSCTVFPSSKTLSLIQDKLIQKTTFDNAGISVANFAQIENHEDLKVFGEKYGYPYVLKTRKFGYDGYGNYTAEAFVNFTKELAVMVVRNKDGENRTYPVVETVQKNHICKEVYAPANISEKSINEAKELAIKCVEVINGVGVFGIESFLLPNGEIVVNEIAPRPHNSGHYTIEACHTSQFENIIRAVCNLPIGSTDMRVGAACMINILGEINGSGVPANINELLAFDKAKFHLYGKETSRIGRKMGHITVTGDNIEATINYARESANSLKWE
jgi:5-(carboxyamino)imidazole ribonucleotide synthase